jgi:hypothetical protein
MALVSNSMWLLVSGSCSVLTGLVSPAVRMEASMFVKNVSCPPDPSSPKNQNTPGQADFG